MSSARSSRRWISPPRPKPRASQALAHGAEARLLPAAEPAVELREISLQHGLRRQRREALAREAGRRIGGALRAADQVHARADDHPRRPAGSVARALDQDAGGLGAVDQDVVRPLQLQIEIRRAEPDQRLAERQARDQGELRRDRHLAVRAEQRPRHRDCRAARPRSGRAGRARGSARRRRPRSRPARRPPPAAGPRRWCWRDGRARGGRSRRAAGRAVTRTAPPPRPAPAPATGSAAGRRPR